MANLSSAAITVVGRARMVGLRGAEGSGASASDQRRDRGLRIALLIGACVKVGSAPA